MMKKIVEWKYIIHGDVQGVGFRATAQRIAFDLNLKGSVRNLENGSVELVVQGPLESIQRLLERLKERFTIKRVDEIPCELTDHLPHFQIVR